MTVRAFLCCLIVSATAQAQSLEIDSLRRNIQNQKPEAQVRSLYQLSKQFFIYWIHSDSAIRYANLSQEKAGSIGDQAGVARAMLLRAAVWGKLLTRPEQMISISDSAISILKNSKDRDALSSAYSQVAWGLAMSGKSKEAIQHALLAKTLAIQSNGKRNLGWALGTLGFVYVKNGDYWKGFENLIEAQRIGKEVKDSFLVAVSLAFIGIAYNRVGDPKTALQYYHEAVNYAPPQMLLWPHLDEMASAHLQLRQFDSVDYYQRKHRLNLELLTTDTRVKKNFTSFPYTFWPTIQLTEKEYDAILTQTLPELNRKRQDRNIVPYMQSLLFVSKAYGGKGQYAMSLKYVRELYQQAAQLNNKNYLKEAAFLYSCLYDSINKPDSSLKYLRQYSAIKDSMELALYPVRTALYLAAYETENKIRLLIKDKAIKEQQLALNRKEMERQSLLKNVLAITLVVSLALLLLIIRNIVLQKKNERLRSEQEKAALKQKALELEMQALRAQMNPHFIFNCLSAIDDLIHTNQADKATTCLSRFAKLIRSVLDSSKNNLVPFAKDFETLKIYLEMEQFRTNYKFSYDLQTDPKLLQGDYKVPPLIIQPFVENAIHHGLLNKSDDNRQLQIYAELQDEKIIYSIIDNGIGRKKAALVKALNNPERQSYGIQITKERIQLHNNNKFLSKDLVITDLEQEGKPAGTKAVVQINCAVT